MIMQNTLHFDVVTDTILRMNGWYPGRDVKFSSLEKELKFRGYSIHDKARSFLCEFYGIAISQVHKSYRGANLIPNDKNHLVLSGHDDFTMQKDMEDSLYRWSLCFGVNQRGQVISYRSESDSFMRIRKTIEHEMGTKLCKVGQEFYGWLSLQGKHHGSWYKCIAKNAETLVAGQFRNASPFGRIFMFEEAHSYIFILEDGRIVLAYDNPSEGIIFKNLRELIYTYYCRSTGCFKQWHKSGIQIDYIEY